MGSQKVTESFALTARRRTARAALLLMFTGSKAMGEKSRLCNLRFCAGWGYLLPGSAHPQLFCEAVASQTHFLATPSASIPLLPVLGLGSVAQAGRRNVSTSLLSISTFSLKWETGFCSPFPFFFLFYGYLLCLFEFASQGLLYDRM